PRCPPLFPYTTLFRSHWTGFHRGMDLVARAVEEPGIDEEDAMARFVDGSLEIGRGAALLVHDADLDGVGGQPQRVFHRGEDGAGDRKSTRLNSSHVKI